MTSDTHLHMCRLRLLHCSNKEGGNIRVGEAVPADNLEIIQHYRVDVVRLSHHKKTKVRLK